MPYSAGTMNLIRWFEYVYYTDYSHNNTFPDTRHILLIVYYMDRIYVYYQYMIKFGTGSRLEDTPCRTVLIIYYTLIYT